MFMSDNFLNAKDFTLQPYQPREYEGDSGRLQLAISKTDESVQYVVKSGMYGLACNEFMYHKVAAVLGLYTPEVKLIIGLPGHKQAGGIRYIPNAQKFIHNDGSETNRRDDYLFQTLYVILNEEDSQEHYIDEQGRLFKLDNAASFNIDFAFHDQITKGRSVGLDKMFRNRLELVEYGKYKIIPNLLAEHYGETAKQTCFSMFERFAAIDEPLLDEAYITLDKVYPKKLSDYYCEFILIRKALCERFLRENGR